MLLEKHFVNYCIENNINMAEFFDKFIEDQIVKNKDPEKHKVLLQIYSENWFANMIGNAGGAIGRTVNTVQQAGQNFKQQYNQARQENNANQVLQAALQASALLKKVGLYDNYFKDAFQKLKNDMMAKSAPAPTAPDAPPTPSPTIAPPSTAPAVPPAAPTV